MELYAEVRSEREGRPFEVGEDQAVMRSTYVASSMEQARREAEEGIMSAFIFNDPFRGQAGVHQSGRGIGPRRESWTGTSWSREPCSSAPQKTWRNGFTNCTRVCNLNYLLVEFTHMGMPLR